LRERVLMEASRADDALDPAHAPEDLIEFGVADVKGQMVALERGILIEQQSERVVDAHRREMAVLFIGL
jgi:hypothetical protein